MESDTDDFEGIQTPILKVGSSELPTTCVASADTDLETNSSHLNTSSFPLSQSVSSTAVDEMDEISKRNYDVIGGDERVKAKEIEEQQKCHDDSEYYMEDSHQEYNSCYYESSKVSSQSNENFEHTENSEELNEVRNCHLISNEAGHHSNSLHGSTIGENMYEDENEANRPDAHACYFSKEMHGNDMSHMPVNQRMIYGEDVNHLASPYHSSENLENSHGIDMLHHVADIHLGYQHSMQANHMHNDNGMMGTSHHSETLHHAISESGGAEMNSSIQSGEMQAMAMNNRMNESHDCDMTHLVSRMGGGPHNMTHNMNMGMNNTVNMSMNNRMMGNMSGMNPSVSNTSSMNSGLTNSGGSLGMSSHMQSSGLGSNNQRMSSTESHHGVHQSMHSEQEMLDEMYCEHIKRRFDATTRFRALVDIVSEIGTLSEIEDNLEFMHEQYSKRHLNDGEVRNYYSVPYYNHMGGSMGAGGGFLLPPLKRGRGRPRKIPLPGEEYIKRSRGRPRKEIETTSIPIALDGASSGSDNDTPEFKRGRGRPRKNIILGDNMVKRPRGRPRKERSDDDGMMVKRPRGRPRKILSDMDPLISQAHQMSLVPPHLGVMDQDNHGPLGMDSESMFKAMQQAMLQSHNTPIETGETSEA